MADDSTTLFRRYTLTCGENTYSSPASVNEADARKLQSLIPSLSGALEREHPSTRFAQTTLPSRIGFFHQFGRNNGAEVNYFWFCATATTLYMLADPGSGASWVAVAPVGTLGGFPTAINIDNAMQLDDSGNGRSWLFDGTNWVRLGLPIPLHQPALGVISAPAALAISSITRGINVVTATVLGSTANYATGMAVTVAGVGDSSFDTTATLLVVSGAILQWNQFGQPDSTSSGGTIAPPNFNILSNRYYWSTWVDQTTGRRQHESSSSPISAGTGAQSGKLFLLNMRFGLTTSDGINVVGTGTDFSQDDVGMVFRCGQAVTGVIKTVADVTHLVLDPAASPYVDGTVSSPAPYTIAPVRATHWNVYASASETDKVGNLLGAVVIDQTNFIDSSPMIGTSGAVFSSVNRPLLNDPPPASIMSEVHKNRIYRRVETNKNFLDFTGLEDINAEQAGSPYECVPGADPNTVSPAQVNEDSFPDQSISIRGFKSHGDALYIGSERDIIPWYGDNNSNFSFAPAYAFKVGLAGQKAQCSTPFGYAFISFDFKVYLYPSQYSFGVDSTTALVELGRPKRDEFEKMDSTDFQNAYLIFYNWGRRNWLVASFKRRDGSFATWGFDFEVKGWFQFQRGYTAVAVLELTPGLKILVGAGTDNVVYVIDDMTGTFPVSGNYPVGYARFLVDFGEPDTYFKVTEIGYEKSIADLEVDVTYWLDPVDPENPGTGIVLFGVATRLGANSYSLRQQLLSLGGSCQRILVEFAIAPSVVNGRFHGFTIEAEKLPANPVL